MAALRMWNPRACHFWPGPQAPTGSIRPCPWTSWKRRLTGEWLMTISSSERNSTFFVELDKLILKYIWRRKRFKNSQDIPEEEEQGSPCLSYPSHL